MNKLFAIAVIAASAIAGYTTAGHAAELGKAGQSAEFRLKVAVCKADAKDSGVKTASTDFYNYMAACIGRVNVAVNLESK